jgi:hypothetical protein
VYVPATISFVLTNMRYTITVQPYLFVFIALTLVTVAEWWRRPSPVRETLRPEARGRMTSFDQ